jgi:hypothetical protein
MTPMDIACQQGHLNIVQHLIRHHRIPPDTLEQWHPRLSSSNKRQLRQTARENLFDCQSFLTLATIVCYIKTEPYQVMDEETGRLVVPRSSILMFRRHHGGILLWMVAGYICGGEETRHIWHLIRKLSVPSNNPFHFGAGGQSLGMSRRGTSDDDLAAALAASRIEF